jgi:hypothetical protein
MRGWNRSLRRIKSSSPVCPHMLKTRKPTCSLTSLLRRGWINDDHRRVRQYLECRLISLTNLTWYELVLEPHGPTNWLFRLHLARNGFLTTIMRQYEIGWVTQERFGSFRNLYNHFTGWLYLTYQFNTFACEDHDSLDMPSRMAVQNRSFSGLKVETSFSSLPCQRTLNSLASARPE